MNQRHALQNRRWRRSAFAVLAFLVMYLGGCSLNRHRIQNNFEAVAAGTSEAALTDIMGRPHEFDSGKTVNSVYATRPCEAPCVRRAWYYNRFQPKGLEAWS